MMTRIITGVCLVALLIFALVMGGWVFSVLYMLTICLAMYEVFRALAEASGGVWAADAATAAAALWEAVGPRERVIVTGLTDSPWFLAAAAGLTVIELALRRRFGLL